LTPGLERPLVGGWPESAVRHCVALLLAVAWPATPSAAQAVYGSIAGTVADSSGAMAPGARLTITSLERGTVDTVTSNASGYYVKDRLLPGRYELKTELIGFKTQVVAPVVVGVDAQTKVDPVLQAGDVTDEITVTATGGQLLKTDRADVATSFEARQVTDLPVLERNFTRFVLLTPGAQEQPWQHGSAENPQGSVQTMVNGQHFSGTGYQLDGTDNRDPILGLIVINPTLESVGEAKVTSQNYDAEFGQAIAGVVSVLTRSGANELHGSAFEFLQRDQFQARNPFTQFQTDPATGRYIPETKRDQFGGSLGGPILRNQWFFFADYEGLRSLVGGSRLLNVPTLRARTGDLGEYEVPIFDPATGDPSVRQPFPGNVIPQGRLSPQALNILSLIPKPNADGRDNGTRENYVASGSETFDGDAFNVRMDGRPTKSVNVFGRYSFAHFTREGPTAFGEGGGPQLVSLGGTSVATNQSLALGLDYTLSPSTLVDVRFGFFRYKVDVRQTDYGTRAAEEAGIPNMNFDDLSSGLPQGFVFGPLGDFTFGSGLGVNVCNCPLTQDEKQFQVVGNFTKALGNHTLKLGVDVRRALNWRVPSDPSRVGNVVFFPQRTSGPNGGGLGLATFLLGDVSLFGRTASQTTAARERQWRHFYYFQDTWRATPKLTLNYGLRLDVINPQTVNEAGNGGFLDLETGEIEVAGVGGIGLDGDVRNSSNWAPRLGVTYRPNEKTVVRMGYGRSYDIGVFGSTFGHTVTQNLPVLAVQLLRSPPFFESVFNLGEGPPPAGFPDVPASGRFPLPDQVVTSALPDKQTLPTVDAWNLTVQRQLSDSLSFEIGYVGNKGTHVFAGDTPDPDANEPTLTGFPDVPTNERQPFFEKFGWTQRIPYYCNCGDNRYDALQAKLAGRPRGGLWLLAHYTLARARQDGPEQFFHDRTLQRGRPDWARTHRFVLAPTYELPFGRGKRFLADASTGLDRLVGGWQVNANVTIQSGLPFEVTYLEAFLDRDVGPNRPDLDGDPYAGGGTQDRWFNATPIGSAGSAFARPEVGTFGNLPRNHLTGPGYWRVDASLFKRVTLTMKTTLELRVEAVNLFNHVNLGLPDGDVGVPGNDNPNAGRISSTANFNRDPQRNLQFGVRLVF
jgi:outer membrane receptor protein involved in Fe transport